MIALRRIGGRLVGHLPALLGPPPLDLSAVAPEPDNGRGLYLPGVRTIIYTTPRAERRHRRVREILSAFGFRNWSFFYGTAGDPYWRFISRDHARLLRENDPPLLILEDDIEPREFCANVEPPAGSQVVYLGGGRGGDLAGVNNARHAGLPVKRAWSYGYTPINQDWMRIYGMWFSHAILWLDKAAMLEAAELLDANDQPIDVTLAREQYRWHVACRTVPMCWQRDGHHYRDTYEYAPEDGERERKVFGRCGR